MKSLAERASAIFDFLRALQIQKFGSVPDYKKYDSQGQWFFDLDDERVDFVKVGRWHSRSVHPMEAPVLLVGKLPLIEPPKPEDDLHPWIEGDISSPMNRPELSSEVLFSNEKNETEIKRLENNPKIQQKFDTWISDWDVWARERKAEEPIRNLYNNIFDAREKLKNMPEEWELVFCIGQFNINFSKDDFLRRHFFTFGCSVELNEKDGALKVLASDTRGFLDEVDWLRDYEHPGKELVEQTRNHLNNSDDYSGENFESIIRQFGHQYKPDLIFERQLRNDEIGKTSLILNPVLILRKRNQRELLKLLQEFSELSLNGLDLPPGIKSVLEPGTVDNSNTNIKWSDDGAVKEFADSDESVAYLPLSLNSRQLDVIRRADSKDLTLVQGPPGTGKTRTIAVLISHFLSKGMRVLVTAQKAQALREVRSQMPREIQELVVTSLGNSQNDNDEIQKSVDKLTQQYDELSYIEDLYKDLPKKIKKIEQNHAKRAELRRRILDIQKAQTENARIGDVQETPGRLAQIVFDQSEKYFWLGQMLEQDEILNISSSDTIELLELIRKYYTNDGILNDKSHFPLVSELVGLDAKRRLKELRQKKSTGKKKALNSSEVESLDQISSQLHNIKQSITELEIKDKEWISNALQDLNKNHNAAWISQLKTLIGEIKKLEILEEKLGLITQYKFPLKLEEINDDFFHLLTQLKEYLENGQKLNYDKSNHIKVGLLAPSFIKNLRPLIQNAQIAGRPITSPKDVDKLIAIIEINRLIENTQKFIEIFDKTEIRDESNAKTLLNIKNVASSLESLHSLTLLLKSLVKDLKTHSIEFSALVTKSDLDNLLENIESQISDYLAIQIEEKIKNQKKTLIRTYPLMAQPIKDFIQALEGDSLEVIASAENELHRHCREFEDRLNLLNKLKSMIKTKTLGENLYKYIVSGLVENRKDQVIDTIADLDNAFKWLDLRTTLRINFPEDYSRIFDEIQAFEFQNQGLMTEVARIRAWHLALKRIDSKTVSAMNRYASHVRKLGKGTGKKAPRIRREIRQLLDLCVDAIPGWVMPIQDVPKFFDTKPKVINGKTEFVFDVVIVDEASQAGLEALFLMMLAKKIVIVGDHKQVSPTNIGLTDLDMESIANRHLQDEVLKPNFMDDSRSLFEEARASFGELIRLTEHRRCVPKIIGFSNEIAYVPEGIRLIPTRQPGSSALPPIKTVFCPDGFMPEKSKRNVNLVEVDAVVEEVLKLVKDENYNGMTIGVISLTGEEQADLIDKRLRDKLSTHEYESRKIRCGTSADFQGSERNVVILSMVTALSANRTYRPLTTEKDVQRFNVAVSRAKDQLILIHSLRAEDISNKDCLRRRLITYCQRHENSHQNEMDGVVGLVGESDRDSRFDSLFEQRVHNLITERGYAVVPQFPVEVDRGDFRIDLVVVGDYGKLAVECDGDFFHGEEEALADITRQNYLQSCGWQFFRVTESDFYANRERALAPLWDRLEEIGLPTQNNSELQNSELTTDDDSDFYEIVRDFTSDVNPEAAREDSNIEEELENEEQGSFRKFTQEKVEWRSHTRNLKLNLVEYNTWEPNLERTYIDATNGNSEIIGELIEIVSVEGPILKSLLARRHHRATGGSSLSKSTEFEYRKFIDKAVSNGLLKRQIVEEPSFRRDATVYAEGQDLNLPRTAGERLLYQIPHLELLALITQVIDEYGLKDHQTDQIFRLTLDSLEITRLTEKANNYLLKILKLK